MNIVDKYISHYTPAILGVKDECTSWADRALSLLSRIADNTEPLAGISPLDYVYVRKAVALATSPLVFSPLETASEVYEITFIALPQTVAGCSLKLNNETIMSSISSSPSSANLSGSGLFYRPGDVFTLSSADAAVATLLIVMRKVGDRVPVSTHGETSSENLPIGDEVLSDQDWTRHIDPSVQLGLLPNPVGDYHPRH